MHILPDYNFPYPINDVNGPISPKYCWFYDVSVNDMLLRRIQLLEETTGPTVKVKINDFIFDVPASWNLLIVDPDTKLIDTIPITQSSNSLAFLIHPEMTSYVQSPVTLIDLEIKKSCVHVMIPKMHMLLHPVGPIKSINKPDCFLSCLLTPQDLGKHMIGMSAMELLV